MLRRDGLLNFSQINDLIFEELRETIEGIESSGGNPSGMDRAFAWETWHLRMVLEDCAEVYLLHHDEEPVRIDAAPIFLARPGFESRAGQIDLVEPLTTAALNTYIAQLYAAWEYVDLLHGLFLVPRRLSRSYLFGGKYKRYLDDRLRVFSGRTVAIPEATAHQSVERFRGWLAAQKDDASRDGDTPDSSLLNVFRTYSQAFPNGKGGATWSDVEKRTGYSRRHLTRAIKAFEGRD